MEHLKLLKSINEAYESNGIAVGVEERKFIIESS